MDYRQFRKKGFSNHSSFGKDGVFYNQVGYFKLIIVPRCCFNTRQTFLSGTLLNMECDLSAYV